MVRMGSGDGGDGGEVVVVSCLYMHERAGAGACVSELSCVACGR